MIEVVLVYRPSGVGAEGEFRLARSEDPAVIRATGAAALAELRAAVEVWAGIDNNLARMRQTEVDRLEQVLQLVVPPESAPPAPLKLVPGNGRSREQKK